MLSFLKICKNIIFFAFQPLVKYYGSNAFQENIILKVWESIICDCLVYKIPTILSKLYIYRADEGFAFLRLEFSAGHDGCLGYRLVH